MNMKRFLWVIYLTLFPLNIFAMQTILVMGDSLSAAYGINPEQGWVSLFANRIKAQHLPYQVVNASQSGETSSEGLAKLPSLLATHHPSLVIIGLGSNDGLRGLSLPAMQENLIQMVALSKKAGAKVLLVGFLIPINYGPLYRAQFEKVFKTVAEQDHLLRVPFLLEGIVLNPNLMQNDGLHPNEAAQPLILKTVWPYFKKLLAET